MATYEDVKAVFKTARWDEKAYLEADGVKLSRAQFDLTYTGEIEGESTTDSLMVYGTDGSSSFVALERFTGSVRGRKGTMVIQIEGTWRDGVVDSRGVIVPAASTGALRGIQGEVPYKSGHVEQYAIVYRLAFP